MHIEMSYDSNINIHTKDNTALNSSNHKVHSLYSWWVECIWLYFLDGLSVFAFPQVYISYTTQCSLFTAIHCVMNVVHFCQNDSYLLRLLVHCVLCVKIDMLFDYENHYVMNVVVFHQELPSLNAGDLCQPGEFHFVYIYCTELFHQESQHLYGLWYKGCAC